MSGINFLTIGDKNLRFHITLLWVIVLFVLISVIVTVYAGLYEGLGKREFPSTDVNGKLHVNGAIDTDNNLTVDGTATLTGAVAAGGTLAVTGATTLTGAVTTSGAATVEGLLKSSKLMQSYSTANAAPTAMVAGALTVNTHYNSIADATAMTIPSAAAGSIGDFITVFYDTAITNAANHTYTTTTDTAFALGSTCTRIGGAAPSTGAISTVDDNVLTITGNANGDGGIGTYVSFVNMSGALNGWAVEAVTTNQGIGTSEGTIGFT